MPAKMRDDRPVNDSDLGSLLAALTPTQVELDKQLREFAAEGDELLARLLKEYEAPLQKILMTERSSERLAAGHSNSEPDPMPDPNATATDVARWMLSQVEIHGELAQADAVAYIGYHFGVRYVYSNENGNPAIARDVLNKFAKFTRDSVVWSHAGRYWRVRTPNDPPDRRRVD